MTAHGYAGQIGSILERARELTSPCVVCPRGCEVHRDRSEVGFCGASSSGRVFRSGLLIGEEPEISPTYAFWFSGCNMACSFCSTRTAQLESGLTLADLDLAIAEAKTLVESGTVRTVSIIGGEPSVSLNGSLELAWRFKGMVPIVWNTNLYVVNEALELIKSVADIFIVDVHFGNDRCAEEIANMPGYLEVLNANLERIEADKLLLRHLLLPGHGECCLRGVVNIASRIPARKFSLLTNFSPYDVDISRSGSWGPLSDEEIENAESLLTESGIEFSLIGRGATDESPRYKIDAASDELLEMTIDSDGTVVFESQSPSVPEIADSLRSVAFPTKGVT
ncbi:MAG: radical SAM protein [Candidatus Coatesbacteria bacterium]|nr:radical SAM protein [Candidatus Coatesbacteria bacterium]